MGRDLAHQGGFQAASAVRCLPCVGISLAALVSSAAAFGAQDASSAPAQEAPSVAVQGAATAPVSDTAPTEDNTAIAIENPSGPLLAAGLLLFPDGGSIGYRVDAGTVLSSSERSELRLLAAITFSPVSAAGIDTYSLAPFATLQYARTVLQRHNGRFALIGELGGGPIFAWIKYPDEPYVPSHWDSDVRPGGRLAGAVEYRSTRGWFGLLQPAGALIALVDGELEAAFELGVRLGYQFP
jgi:hypothetical protein